MTDPLAPLAVPPSLAPSISVLPDRHKFDYEIFHLSDRSHWRTWLAHLHDDRRGVWMCSWRSEDLATSCVDVDSVLEAL